MSTLTAALARQGVPSAQCFRRLLGSVVAGVLASMFVPTEVQADVKSAQATGTAWLIKSQRGDGSWATSLGELPVQSTSAALLALRRAGQAKSPSFGVGVAWLANADADSVDSIARKIEALSYTGNFSVIQTEVARLEALQAADSVAAWGGYEAHGADFVDIALGLAAMRLGDPSFVRKAYNERYIVDIVCLLAGSQVAVSAGKRAWPMAQVTSLQEFAQGRPSALATALLVTELSALQSSMTSAISFACPGFGSFNLTELNAAAISWLKDRQNSGGGFGEIRTDGSTGPSSVLLTALIIKAFVSQSTIPQAAVDAATNWLLSKQNSTTGSWEADPLVTASVLNALPSASGSHLLDSDKDGITDVVETQLGGSPSTSDSRDQLGAPTFGGHGGTAAAVVLKAVVGLPFSHDLGSGVSYSISSGDLPPGLQLNGANGLISGTPNRPGAYSFQYEAGTAGDVVIGRIDVASVDESGDTPLPAWSLLIFAGVLLGGLRRHLTR